MTGRTWRGSAFGGVKGRTELPGLVEGESPCSRQKLVLIHVHVRLLARQSQGRRVRHSP